MAMKKWWSKKSASSFQTLVTRVTYIGFKISCFSVLVVPYRPFFRRPFFNAGPFNAGPNSAGFENEANAY